MEQIVQFPVELVYPLLQLFHNLGIFRVQHPVIPFPLLLEKLHVLLVLFHRQYILGRVVLRLLRQHAGRLGHVYLDYVLPTHLQHTVHHRHEGALPKIVGKQQFSYSLLLRSLLHQHFHVGRGYVRLRLYLVPSHRDDALGPLLNNKMASS